MWRLLSAELRCNRPVLLISWAFGLGIYALVLAVIAVAAGVRGHGDVADLASQLPLALLIASMVACFITTGTDRSESRVRLLAMLPIPVRDLAVARVLVPVAMMALGALVSHVALFFVLLAKGAAANWPRNLVVDFLGALFLLWVLVALAAREIIEVRKSQGWRSALLPKVVVALAVALAVALQVLQPGHFGTVTAATAALDVLVATMVVRMFCRRTDFTR